MLPRSQVWAIIKLQFRGSLGNNQGCFCGHNCKHSSRYDRPEAQI